MNREEMIEKSNTVICNLSDEGKEEQKKVFERMERKANKTKNAMFSLTSERRRLFDKIESVKKMDISRYDMKIREVMLLAEIYNNNYGEASYETFCLGFYQGLKYAENRMKTQKSV